VTAAHHDHHEKITRDDLEAKFRTLAGEGQELAGQAKSYGIAAAAVIVVVIVVVSFLAGRRRGKAKSTIVEIRRI
jgi:hypothetical protein